MAPPARGGGIMGVAGRDPNPGLARGTNTVRGGDAIPKPIPPPITGREAMAVRDEKTGVYRRGAYRKAAAGKGAKAETERPG
jgi:hypothetical protein